MAKKRPRRQAHAKPPLDREQVQAFLEADQRAKQERLQACQQAVTEACRKYGVRLAPHVEVTHEGVVKQDVIFVALDDFEPPSE